MPPEQILIVGALLVAGAFAWRAAVRARTAAVLRRAARDPRRWVRRAAIEVMAEQGLHRFGKLLAERIEIEDVPAVREALAIAIVRNQWEPADSLLMMRLRLWAHLELEGRREAELIPRAGYPVGGKVAISDPDSGAHALTDGSERAATVHRLRRASGQR